MNKIIKNKKLIKRTICNFKLTIYKFDVIKLKAFLIKNGNYKVYKKSNYINPQIVINKQNKDSNYKKNINVKYKKTNKNQLIVSYIHKTDNIKKTLTKNCYYLTKQNNTFLQYLFLVFAGLIIGFINGFWGGGGGMICVPILTMILGLENKKAHATTLFIMLHLSVASLIIYMLKGNFNWTVTGVIGSGFVLGGVLGAIILKKINNVVLKIIFGIIIIAGAVKLLV